MIERLSIARQKLAGIGQDHILHFFGTLDNSGREKLLGQIESVDWQEAARLAQSHVLDSESAAIPHNLEPAPYYPHVSTDDLSDKYHKARSLGEQLIRENKVAAFTVAGGQGTRLGWDGPKGSFPATPIRKLPLFGCFAEYILRSQEKYNATVPWYIMTSPDNEVQTRDVFECHNYFGIDRDNIMFFPQAMMPAFDRQTGKVLLASTDSIALSPNGHGGSLKALYTSGAIDDMKKRGIEQISYTQVDNPLVRVIDPLFIGLHVADGAQMSSKMLPKTFEKEKLGNFCLVNGKMAVIEYSDLPDELASQRLNNGQLRFCAGSIAIHLIGLDFVESLNASSDSEGFALPYHRAEKAVPHVDLQTANRIEPTAPNAVKLETFVFDALPLCDVSIVYETDRVEEFAPIKNADADPLAESVDSPYTSSQLQIERAARWLQRKGVAVPRRDGQQVDAVIEISQRTAIEADDLNGAQLPQEIGRGSQVLL